MARRLRSKKQPNPDFIREIAEGVGFAVIAATQIEHILSIVMAKMLNLTRLQHRVLIIPMSTTTKITTLRQLGREYLPPDGVKTLKVFLKDLKYCADKRNELAHGFYGAKNGKFDLLTFSGDGRFSGQPVSWTPTTLMTLRTRMIAVRDRIPLIYGLFPKRLKLPKSLPPIA